MLQDLPCEQGYPSHSLYISICSSEVNHSSIHLDVLLGLPLHYAGGLRRPVAGKNRRLAVCPQPASLPACQPTSHPRTHLLPGHDMTGQGGAGQVSSGRRRQAVPQHARMHATDVGRHEWRGERRRMLLPHCCSAVAMGRRMLSFLCVSVSVAVLLLFRCRSVIWAPRLEVDSGL